MRGERSGQQCRKLPLTRPAFAALRRSTSPRKRGEVKTERAEHVRVPRHVIQRLQQIRPEIPVVLDHREMPHALHDGHARARNARRDLLGHLRRARVVVLAGEQRDLAAVGVDALDVFAAVPVVAVEMDVALINARPRLAVVPPVLAPAPLRAGRRVEAVGVARGELAAVDRRMMQQFVVAPRRVGRAFQPDDSRKLVLKFRRDLQHDRAAHRAAHHHRPLEAELEPHRADHRQIALRGEAILLQPPAVRRRRAAVIRQIERDDAEAVGHLLVVEHMAVLPRVRARGVQA